MYAQKKLSLKEQLKAFNFHELFITETEADETVNVTFTREEKMAIIKYGSRVQSEADIIEKDRGRVIFYYDSMDSLVSRFSSGEEVELTKSDLLTIIEIFQIFCDDPDFPDFLDESIASIISFFYAGAQS